MYYFGVGFVAIIGGFFGGLQYAE